MGVQIPQVELRRVDQVTDFASAFENKYFAESSLLLSNNSESERLALGSFLSILLIKSFANSSMSFKLIL